jgi:uncharacterized membrane protein YraQ (UPF0718 family)
MLNIHGFRLTLFFFQSWVEEIIRLGLAVAVAVVVGGICGLGRCTGSKRSMGAGEVITEAGRANVILDAVLIFNAKNSHGAKSPVVGEEKTNQRCSAFHERESRIVMSSSPLNGRGDSAAFRQSLHCVR